MNIELTPTVAVTLITSFFGVVTLALRLVLSKK